ncbi:MAG: ComF family protein [Candidatus Melainabacteria bacterium]
MLVYWIDKLKHALRTHQCQHCAARLESQTDAFCPDCQAALDFRDSHPLFKINASSPTVCYAATLMNPLVKKILYGYKFYLKPDARRKLGEILCHYWQHLSERPPSGNTLVISIPPHTGKLDTVRYLARQLAHRFDYDWRTDGLSWTREVATQHDLSQRHARFHNINHSMACTLEKLPGHVIVIDDLTTTGATLIEALRAVHERASELGRPVEVVGLAASHVPLTFQRSRHQNKSRYEPLDPSPSQPLQDAVFPLD